MAAFRISVGVDRPGPASMYTVHVKLLDVRYRVFNFLGFGKCGSYKDQALKASKKAHVMRLASLNLFLGELLVKVCQVLVAWWLLFLRLFHV